MTIFPANKVLRRCTLFMIHCTLIILLVILFRALAFTIYTIDGRGLSPLFMEGDRVLVNRWSYGLRVGGDKSLFNYGRICRHPVEKGDIVAFEDPRDDNREAILICRCAAVPGDSVSHNDRVMVVPGLRDCADADYYWMESIGHGNPIDSRQLGFISEKLIIGRVCRIVYSHDPSQSLFKGWRGQRIWRTI